jgi:DNA-binding response OmpR family regulator
MPTAAQFPKALADPGSKDCAFDKASVCLLDDDPSMLKALDRLLKSDGFNVEKFCQPAAFLAAVEQAPCRVAILDVWMPDMNGLEVQAITSNNRIIPINPLDRRFSLKGSAAQRNIGLSCQQ